MKTVVCAGFDNFTFTAVDWINPKELKLIACATTIEEAYNIYDENGGIKENIDEMPIMPIGAALALEPDIVIMCATNQDDEDRLKMMLVQADHRGEVMSLFDFFSQFSIKTAVIRKLSWRLGSLGVDGSIGELGSQLGDISWQMNALMPERKMILFDTYVNASPEKLINRFPYKDNVYINVGSFPDSAADAENETYAMAHITSMDLETVKCGLLYFFPRMSKGGVIILSNYENGISYDVHQAVDELEKEYGAFLLLPMGDLEGSVIIVKP